MLTGYTGMSRLEIGVVSMAAGRQIVVKHVMQALAG